MIDFIPGITSININWTEKYCFKWYLKDEMLIYIDTYHLHQTNSNTNMKIITFNIDYTYSIQVTHIHTYRLWSPMLRFVFDNINNIFDTLEWGKPYRTFIVFCERFVRMYNQVSRGALRRLVVTTLYVLYSPTFTMQFNFKFNLNLYI